MRREVGDSPRSRWIRRVVSDDGGPRGHLSPLDVRQAMSFDAQQRLILSPAEDEGERGVEVNLTDFSHQSEEGTNDKDRKVSASLQSNVLNHLSHESSVGKQRKAGGKGNRFPNQIALPSLGETSLSDSQSSFEHKIRIRDSIAGAQATVSEAKKPSVGGIGSVLAASKCSDYAAQAAMELAGKVLAGRSGKKPKSVETVAPPSMEDHIISEARNAAVHMKSSSQILRLVQGKATKEQKKAPIAKVGGGSTVDLASDLSSNSKQLTSISGSSEVPLSPNLSKDEPLEPQEQRPSPEADVGEVSPKGQEDESVEPMKPTVMLGNNGKTSLPTTLKDDSTESKKPPLKPPSIRGTNVPTRTNNESIVPRKQQESGGIERESTDRLEIRSAEPASPVPLSSAQAIDDALESSPGGGIDVCDDAYSNLPGKLSNLPNVTTRKEILNTLDGFDKSPARLRKSFLPLSESPQCPDLPDALVSGKDGLSPSKQFLLPRNDSNLSNPRSLDECVSSMHDFLSDVRTNLVASHVTKTDGRMHAWMRQAADRNAEEANEKGDDEYAMYTLGESRTLIVHEIRRGDWTWCSAWSPEGNRLAVATENHHLAIIDTSSSSVWKVVHDRRMSGRPMKGTTHSIRSIAWGAQFIAIGGTGDSVSIVFPSGNYPIVHIINGTGFVGSLSWRAESSILAIGSREDKCMVVDIKTNIEERSSVGGRERKKTVTSKLLHTVKRRDWVNAVAFSADGKNIAMGDRSGMLSVYMYLAFSRTTSPCKDFQFKAAVLDISWSLDRSWLYASGEDFAVTVINASSWEIVRRIERRRWCDCVAPSHGGEHVVAGGGKSGLSIFGVGHGWSQLKHFDYCGMIPLSAAWHPEDHYLAMTGQSEIIAAIETSDIPYMKGKYVKSKSNIASVDFSPDGKIMAVANANGLVSFFDTMKAELTILYELVCCESSTKCIRWSPNGQLVAVAGGDTVVVLNSSPSKKKSRAVTASGLTLRQIKKGLDGVESIAFSPDSRMIAVNGPTTEIYDPLSKFRRMLRLRKDIVLVSSWSPDGTLFAMVGKGKHLTIYDTSESVEQWKIIFTLLSDGAGLALAWGPSVRGGLQYLACGGEGKKITVLEIRTQEMTWEAVVVVPRPAKITAMDWHKSGLLAVACSDGSTTVVDLAYLQSGKAVNEMDYNWQRQGCLCFTEIMRKDNGNAMTTLRWMGTGPSGKKALALGGTDGVVEIINLSERRWTKQRLQEMT